MRRAAEILYRFRFFWLGLIMLITILSALSINIKMDNSVKAWFSADDPDYLAYEKLGDTFGGTRFLIIALQAEDIFSADILRYIKAQTELLEGLPQVKRVHSLANANKIIGSAEGLEINPLLAGMETADTQRIKQYALSDELLNGYLFSPDAAFAAIVLTLREMSDQETANLLAQVKKIISAGKPEGVTCHLSGYLMAAAEFNRFTKQIQDDFSRWLFILIMLFLFIYLRSIPRVIIVFLVLVFTVCWALGFCSLMGYTFNGITAMLIPLLLILSIASAVHIMTYYDEMRGKYAVQEAFLRTVRYITLPCFLTGITTAFGLLSLAVTKVAAIRNFGVGAAAGIIFAFVISLILVPLALTFLPACPRKRPIKTFSWDWLLNGVYQINKRGFRYILLLTALSLVFCGWGIKKVSIETDEIEWFPHHSDMYKATMLVDKHLSGIGDMQVVLEGEEGILKEADILQRMDRLSAGIKKLPHVRKTLSLADYVKRINKALNEDNPQEYRIPENNALVAQEVFLFSLSDDGRKELENIVTTDFAQGRISVSMEKMTSREKVETGKLIEKLAKETFSGTGLTVTMTGSYYLYSLLYEYLVQSQLSSFGGAFLLVIGVLFIVFKSLTYGTFTILPNVVPIVWIIGIMGWLGISLNTGTVMIASVVLGITVDDTIHFLSRFRKELQDNRGRFHDSLIKDTFRFAGQAVILTSVVNSAGFLIFLFSGFRPTKEFGGLVALTLFVSLIGDLFILPSTMFAARRFLGNRVTAR